MHNFLTWILLAISLSYNTFLKGHDVSTFQQLFGLLLNDHIYQNQTGNH